MKVWAVAWNTYRGLLRNRALLALILLFLLLFLGSASELFYASRLARAGAEEQARTMFAQGIQSLLLGHAVYAFILAILTGAFVLPAEIKAGTIVPTLGRALSRTQFLLGLFVGANLLLATYLVLAILATAGLLVWSGVVVESHLLWGLLYVALVAGIVGGLAFLFSTVLNPVLTLFATCFFLLLPRVVNVIGLWSQGWAERLGKVADYLLPAWGLLAYEEYLVVTRSPVVHEPRYFLVGIAHALDYLAIVLLLALLVFRRRSLFPPS